MADTNLIQAGHVIKIIEEQSLGELSTLVPIPSHASLSAQNPDSMEIKDKADLVLIPLIECIILFLMCLYLLRGYADKKRTSLCIKMLTLIMWFLSFSLVVFVPVDVFMSNNMKQFQSDTSSPSSSDDPAASDPSNSYMFEWWAFTYWTGNILGYFVIPLAQGYVIAGEF